MPQLVLELIEQLCTTCTSYESCMGLISRTHMFQDSSSTGSAGTGPNVRSWWEIRGFRKPALIRSTGEQKPNPVTKVFLIPHVISSAIPMLSRTAFSKYFAFHQQVVICISAIILLDKRDTLTVDLAFDAHSQFAKMNDSRIQLVMCGRL